MNIVAMQGAQGLWHEVAQQLLQAVGADGERGMPQHRSQVLGTVVHAAPLVRHNHVPAMPPCPDELQDKEGVSAHTCKWGARDQGISTQAHTQASLITA